MINAILAIHTSQYIARHYGVALVGKRGAPRRSLLALATIRALRSDVAARVQGARDVATEIGAAYQEWVASQQAWLVVSGQVLDPMVKGVS